MDIDEARQETPCQTLSCISFSWPSPCLPSSAWAWAKRPNAIGLSVLELSGVDHEAGIVRRCNVDMRRQVHWTCRRLAQNDETDAGTPLQTPRPCGG